MTHNKVTQRTVLYLGEINQLQEAAWQDLLDRFDSECQGQTVKPFRQQPLLAPTSLRPDEVDATSYSAWCESPSFSASTKASPTPIIEMPRIMLLQIFAAWPAPASPQSSRRGRGCGWRGSVHAAEHHLSDHKEGFRAVGSLPF